MKKTKQVFWIVVIFIIVSVLSACGQDVNEDSTGAADTAMSSGQEAEATDKAVQEPKNTAEKSAAGDNILSEKESWMEEGSPSSSFPDSREMEWTIYSEGTYCYSNGSLCGYLSENGEEITSCIYEDAAPFSEGLACVRKNGKYGYIGRDGAEVIPFRFDQAASFREGAAYFSCGEEYGLIDHNGNVILDLTDSGFDSISSFREGLAYFSADGLYGYMDKTGEIVIDPVYGDAGYFYDGLAMVMKDGFFGLIEKDGREVLSPKYSKIKVEETNIVARKDGEVYCFDKNGEEILSGELDDLWEKDEKIADDTENTEQILLTNQITPGAGPLFDYSKTGSIITNTGTAYMDKMPQGRRFGKLFRLGDQEALVLYFYAKSWRGSRFPESDSGLFTIRNGQVVQLVGANECGGRLRGDWVCFWYDTKKNMLKPGSNGSWEGGLSWYSCGGDVYGLKNGQAILETSFRFERSPGPDGVSEDKYTINDEKVAEEEYDKIKGRFRYYLPIDDFMTGW